MFESLSSNAPLSLDNLNTGLGLQALSGQDLDPVVNAKTPQALSSSDYGLNTQAVDNVLTAFQNESSLKAALGQKPSDQANILLLPDNAGNTLATARSITVGATATSYLDSVGSADTNDYYRFSLSSAGNFNLSLTGLSADADVALLNSSGGVIASSVNGGSTSESIARSLGAGTYYIQVYPYSGSTDYNLTVSAIAGQPDGAGNTLDTARAITVGSTPTSYTDWVGSTDTNDYYRFSLSNTSNFNLSLTGLSADADVALLNSSGGVIASSTAGGSTSESIARSLGAGTYYVRVYPYSGSTDYNLTVSTSVAPPPTPGYNSTTGYGLINAAAAVARGLNQSPFPDVPTFGGPNDWGANLVKAPEVWQQGYTGQGIVVAVVDTGVDRNHSDLNDNIWRNTAETANDGIDNDGNGYIDDVYGWNFVSNNNNTLDDNNHGTHVAGTIAGERNDFGVTGIAYNARIMPVKVLSGSGSGSNSGVAQGIRYAANNGADVINLSLGGGFSSDIQSAVQYAASRGAIVVMAAGNDGLSSPGYPAAHATQWGLAVGAVDSNNTIASFSNRAGGNSALAYVTAPGVNVYSTLPNGGYGNLSGTSMATPHVAGVVALMLSANPNLTDAQVRQIVTSTAGNSATSTSLGNTSLSSDNVASVLGIESGFVAQGGTSGGNILGGNSSQGDDSPKPNSPQKIQSTPVT